VPDLSRQYGGPETSRTYHPATRRHVPNNEEIIRSAVKKHILKFALVEVCEGFSGFHFSSHVLLKHGQLEIQVKFTFLRQQNNPGTLNCP
jgi:hypothetical protein